MRFRYELTALSPVHIGDGNRLTPWDFAVTDRFYRVNLDSLSSDPGLRRERFRQEVRRRDFRWDSFAPELAAKHALYALPFASHAVRSTLASRRRRQEVYEFVKSGGKPYVPGSSIKGALRTAVLLAAVAGSRELRERFLTELRGSLGEKRERLSRQAERAVFGSDPRTDLFRTVKVTDSSPVGSPGLAVYESRVYSGGRYKPFTLLSECMQPGTTVSGYITLDDWLLRPEAREELSFGACVGFLRALEEVLKRAGSYLVQIEAAFYQNTELSRLQAFFGDLRKRVERGECILAIGWGSGWRSKTVGQAVFEYDPELFARIRTRYRLGREKAPFPKSRKLVVDDRGVGIMPLGWVRLSLREVREK